MNLSPQQIAASEAVKRWLDEPKGKPWFYLAGYAGTGKTTIAKALAENTDGTIAFMAYTGKAALVLREKGCSSATTIHSQIYVPVSKSQEHLAKLQAEHRACSDDDRKRELNALIAKEMENLRRPSFSLNLQSQIINARLIVLDEVSMVGRQCGQDLLSFNVPVLALGDPAQLPPVGDAGFFTGHAPDMLLTEIHRQAEGSPIIKLATMVRSGQLVLPQGDHGDSRVMPKGVLSIEELAAHDQVLVGRNKTRRTINNRIRKEVKKFDEHLPVAGDLLMCIKNDAESGLLNGSQWECHSREIVDEDKMLLTIRAPGNPEETYPFQVMAWRHHFEDREKELAPYEMREAQAFEFGYAITVHKSQGSSWKKVAVVDESAVFRQDQAKHLYTAITRASESVTVIQ